MSGNCWSVHDYNQMMWHIISDSKGSTASVHISSRLSGGWVSISLLAVGHSTQEYHHSSFPVASSLQWWCTLHTM